MVERIIEFTDRMKKAESEDDYISLLIDLWREPSTQEESYWRTSVNESGETVQTEVYCADILTDEDRSKIKYDIGSVSIDNCKGKQDVIDSLILKCFNELRDRGYTNYEMLGIVCNHSEGTV